MKADRVALVTGAASGIGLATARQFAENGYAVFAVDRDSTGLTRALAALADLAGEVDGLSADVTREPDMLEVSRQAQARFGRIDSVVACAGIEVTGTVRDLDLPHWNDALRVNLTGVFLTAKATIDALIASRGSFTAIASDAGTTGASGYSAYAASKHGVVGLIKCLALDFGPDGVRSNVICPGFVETPMARRLFEKSSEPDEAFYRASIPLGRFAFPEDIAEAALHLARSTYANGVVYALDGGSTAGYFSPRAKGGES